MNSQEILQQNNAILDENNAIIEDILEMVDNIPDSSVALNVYSTEEQIVGAWLNGKNVYRRVFVGSMTGMGTTWTNIAQVLDVDEVINLSGTISNTLTDGRSLNLNTYEDETHNACFSFCKEDNNHLQARITGWSKTEWGFVFKLYFEYTKTTDEANSSVIAYYPILEINNYSAGEQVIGTYVNGETLYRKVMVETLDGSWKENGVTFSWIDLGVKVDKVARLSVSLTPNEEFIYTEASNKDMVVSLRNGRGGITTTELQVGLTTSMFANQEIDIIIEYTKITD